MERSASHTKGDRRRSPARPGPGPFAVKDCALLAIATGTRAQNLREFRDLVRQVPAASLDYHFWGRLLRPDFDDPEFSNDFSSWARHGLHDHPLAERLGVIDPTDFEDLEGVRREIIEVVEQRLEESDWVPWARRDQQFHFLRSQIVVFDSPRRFAQPRELAAGFSSLPLTSIYYHVIDARRRTPQRTDDFRAWLSGFGESDKELATRLGFIDPFLSTLSELRAQFAEALEAHYARRD
jgi:hypothetical protein